MKDLKKNYKILRRVYNSTNSNIGEQLKLYLVSLPTNEIDRIENDFKVNFDKLLK